MTTRNQKTYDPETGIVTVTNPKGEVMLERPARNPDRALAEFHYACRTWFACMPLEGTWRQNAVAYAVRCAEDVPFDPNVEPLKG